MLMASARIEVDANCKPDSLYLVLKGYLWGACILLTTNKSFGK